MFRRLVESSFTLARVPITNMEKLKNLYQKIIHSPKLLALSGITIFSIILIIYTAVSFKSKEKPISTGAPTTITPTSTPAVGPITREEPFPTPSLSIRWSTKEVEIPSTMEIFTANQPLINPQNADTFAQKLGFTRDEEQESIDVNFKAWAKGNISMSTNFLDNELIFSSGNTPTATNTNYSEDSYYLAANNYLQNIFGAKFVQSLVKQGLSYSKQQNFYTINVPANEATLVRVSYYQSLDSYPLTTTSQTGAIVTLLLDKNLGLQNLSVKDAFIGVISLGDFKTTPLSALISNSNSTALRINASLYNDIAIDTVSARNITFNQATVQVAYFFHNKQLIPVYLLKGSIKTSVTEEQQGLYILPALSQQ